MSDTINKVVGLLKKRNRQKESGIVDRIFGNRQLEVETICPICGNSSGPDPDCILCDGNGEIISDIEDDDEDKRVAEKLKTK